MQTLQSQTDILESRLQLHEGNNSHFQAYVATPYGLRAPRCAFQSILFLPHQPPPYPVLPAQAMHWPSCHAVHRKRGTKQPFPPSARSLLMCFGLVAQEGTGTSSSPLQILPVHPICSQVGFGLSPNAGGPGESQPQGIFAAVTPGRTPARGMDGREGEVCGTTCLCKKAAGSRRKNACARWEGGPRESTVCNLGRGKGPPLRHAAA